MLTYTLFSTQAVVHNFTAASSDGAARYGVSPTAFVTTRLVRYSFGVVVNTKYDHVKHRFADRLTFRDDPGAVSTDVIRRLAAKGARVATARVPPTDPSASVTRLWPSSTSSTQQVFQFMRTSLDLPDFADPVRVAVPKDPPSGITVPLTAAGLPQTVFVPRSCVVAEVTVPMPSGMKSINDGECLVQFHFGRAEIEAEVTVIRTGRVRRCAIKYISDRPASVRGAAHAAFDDDDSDEDDEEGGAGGKGDAAAGGRSAAVRTGKAAVRSGRRHPPSVFVKGLAHGTTELDLQVCGPRG